MYVIEVTPLVRGTVVGSLSYYSGVEYKVGSIINIPLRNKKVQALVTENKPVSKAKTALKAATFSLRKLEPQTDPVILPESIMKTGQELTKQYPATLGSILYSLLPPDIRAGLKDYPKTTSHFGHEDTTPYIFTGLTEDRFLVYKSKIREAFVHRSSVLLIVPTSVDVRKTKEKLCHGIEKRVVTFSSIHTKKELRDAYQAFDDLSNAKLIITTPNFALLERHDITTIIVEESGSPHYKNRTRPYLDMRDVFKTYARVSGKSILLSDVLPCTEDEEKRRDETYHTLDEHTKRLQFNTSFTVTMHDNKPGAEFSIFTHDLVDSINLTLKNKGRAYLFAARKGLAPIVTCYDCGHIFRCPESGAPYSLFRTQKGEEEERWFVCSTSGKRVRAADICPNCGSWRLRERGIGIQQVETAAKKLWPKKTILRLDHDTASTHKKAERILSEFYKTKGAILIGTAMAIPYLEKPVELTAITSYEALRSIPTWRAEEHVLSTILNLREKTLKDCIVQIRSDEDKLLKIAKKGLIDQFYDDETEIRAMVKYPPFAHFVLLTYTGNKEQVKNLEGSIESILVGYKIQSYSTPIPKPNSYTRHTLIKLKNKDWPDEKLMDLLRSLPPQIKMEVNPTRII